MGANCRRHKHSSIGANFAVTNKRIAIHTQALY